MPESIAFIIMKSFLACAGKFSVKKFEILDRTFRHCLLRRDNELGEESHQPCSHESVYRHFTVTASISWVTSCASFGQIVTRRLFSYKSEESFDEVRRCRLLARFQLLHDTAFQLVHVIAVLFLNYQCGKVVHSWHLTAKVFAHRCVEAILQLVSLWAETLRPFFSNEH